MYKNLLNFKVVYNSNYIGCPNCGMPCKYVFDMFIYRNKLKKYNYKSKYNYLKMKKIFKTTNYYKKNKISFR